VDDVRKRMESGGWDICVVVNERRVVLGADPDGTVEAVMNPGPATYRPNVPVGDLLRIMRDRDLHGNSLVTTPDGVLLGTVSRDQAEQAATT